MALHAAAALALVIVPLLLADALPEPDGGTRAFFVEPIAAPPPPPAAAPGGERGRRDPRGPEGPGGRPGRLRRADRGADRDHARGGPRPRRSRGRGGRAESRAAFRAASSGGVVGGLPDAPPPPPAKPVRVGGDIREPRKVVDVAPVYPELAMKAGVEGIVIIEATIDPRGRVVNATVLRGVPVLDEAALEAVRQVGLHAHPPRRRADAGHHDGDGSLPAEDGELKAVLLRPPRSRPARRGPAVAFQG